jgi:hypothetical protein
MASHTRVSSDRRPRPVDRRLLFAVFPWGIASLGCQGASLDPKHGKVFDLEVLSTEKCPLPTPAGAPERAALGIKVKLTARVPEGVASNYFYASVLAADGARYLAELAGCSPVLSGAPLQLGQESIGYLNIPIPAHKQPRALVYAPPVAAYPVARRTREVELGRAEVDEHE